MLLAKSDTAERKAVFRQCWETVMETISEANIGQKHPAYYYFKGVCLAYWGEAAGTLASLPYVPTIKSLMETGLTLDTRFEGGGAHRLAAGVYSNKKAQPLGLYKPDKALEHAQAAKASAAYPGDALNGEGYFENWRAVSLCYIELDNKDQAKVEFQNGIDKIEQLQSDDELPSGREPETIWVLSKLQEELDDLNAE